MSSQLTSFTEKRTSYVPTVSSPLNPDSPYHIPLIHGPSGHCPGKRRIGARGKPHQPSPSPQGDHAKKVGDCFSSNRSCSGHSQRQQKKAPSSSSAPRNNRNDSPAQRLLRQKAAVAFRSEKNRDALVDVPGMVSQHCHDQNDVIRVRVEDLEVEARLIKAENERAKEDKLRRQNQQQLARTPGTLNIQLVEIAGGDVGLVNVPLSSSSFGEEPRPLIGNKMFQHRGGKLGYEHTPLLLGFSDNRSDHQMTSQTAVVLKDLQYAAEKAKSTTEKNSSNSVKHDENIDGIVNWLVSARRFGRQNRPHKGEAEEKGVVTTVRQQQGGHVSGHVMMIPLHHEPPPGERPTRSQGVRIVRRLLLVFGVMCALCVMHAIQMAQRNKSAVTKMERR